MHLDEFKPLTREITAPASAPSARQNLERFIAEMRTRDQQERRRLLGMSVVYLGLGLVLATGVMWKSGHPVIGIGIMLVALYAAAKARRFGRVDYAASTREFLAAAARRYQFCTAREAVYVIPLWLVFGFGGGLVVWETARRYFAQEGRLIALGGYGVFLAAVTIFGLVQGRRAWRRDKAAVLEEIRRCERELQNG